MDHSKELRIIADDIVKTEAGGLDNSQYWGLRLRLLADILESGNAPITSHSSRSNNKLLPSEKAIRKAKARGELSPRKHPDPST